MSIVSCDSGFLEPYSEFQGFGLPDSGSEGTHIIYLLSYTRYVNYKIMPLSMKARQLARAGRIPARRASGYAVTVKCFRSRTVKLAAFLVQKWLSLKSLSSSNQVYLLTSHFLTHKTTFKGKNGNTQDWRNKCEFRRRLARRLHFTLLISGYL